MIKEEEQNLIKKQGIAKNPQEKEINGKMMYFFDIDNQTYSGWGHSPVKEGDTITFKYEDNEYNGKTYHNVKYVYNINQTNEEPNTQELKKSIDMPKMSFFEIKGLILYAAVRLCIARNDLSDKSIDAAYKRLIKLLEDKNEG